MKRLVACCVILMASTVANLMLIRSNTVLASQVEALKRQLETPLNVPLPPLEGLGLDGKPLEVAVQHSAVPTLLFVLSPECAVCANNWSRWDELLSKQAESTWKPIFVNMGSSLSQAYMRSHGLEKFTVLNNVSKNTSLAYKFLYTPETILIDRDGQAQEVWVGLLSSEVIKSIPRVMSTLRN
jgi:hypothetical protein